MEGSVDFPTQKVFNSDNFLASIIINYPRCFNVSVDLGFQEHTVRRKYNLVEENSLLIQVIVIW